VDLGLKWNANSDDSKKEREELDKLQPSKHLKELSIWSYGGTRFPDWFGDNSLSNLVFLTLSDCKNCVLLPPLGILPSLKKLGIIGLSGIVVIGSEFYGNGSSSSSGIIPFSSLETLIFENMKRWEEWDCNIVTGAFPCLEELVIDSCPNLKECLPEKLSRLMQLRISECRQLVSSVSLGPPIQYLHLSDCGKLRFNYQPSTLRLLKIGGQYMEGSMLEWIEHILSHTSLESLVIEECPTMNITLGCCYNFLLSLDITGSCESLTTFPLDYFPKLLTLELKHCTNLEMISKEHEHDCSLTSLIIKWCPKFVSFPKGGFFAPKLEHFQLYMLENLKSLPECMHTLFPTLTKLKISNCPQLESFSNGGLPSSLIRMKLDTCSKLLIVSLKCALGINTSLNRLSIICVDVESFPEEGLLPVSLTYLHISCCLNLKKLDNKGLCHLSALQELHLLNCPELQCLPVEGLPKSISTIEILHCSLLKQRCKKPNGEDWGKISHIECVIIDRFRCN